MNTENVKNEARRLLDRLPEDITWDELMHEIYVQSRENCRRESGQGEIWITIVRVFWTEAALSQLQPFTTTLVTRHQSMPCE